MRILSIILFIVTFTIEVKVRASEFTIVETPDNCLSSSEYCVIKNISKKFLFKNGSFQISMSPESTIIRQKPREISFVGGQIFVKTSSKISFVVPYGQIEVEPDSQVILEKFNDKVVVQTIFGKSYLRPLGEKKAILVSEGHENFISEVDGSLKAQTGIPKPIVIEPLLKAWFYHADLKKEKFVEAVEAFKSIHEKAVKELSILNEQIASREIASAKAAKSAAEERARKAKEHRELMQNMYYQRLLAE